MMAPDTTPAFETRKLINQHIRELFGFCRLHEHELTEAQRIDIMAACARLNRAAGNGTPYEAFTMYEETESH